MNKEPRFFIPFKGVKYTEGITGKHILVIGASHYCNKNECPYFKDCTNEVSKDSSKYNSECWYYKQNHISMLLSEETINEVESGMEIKSHAYRRFAKFISQEYLNIEDYYNAWDYMAFANYVQFLLPHWKTLSSDLSDRDFQSFIQTVEELKPDIIIVWGDTVNQPIRNIAINSYLDNHIQELEETEWYMCHMIPPSMKRIPMVFCVHPSAPSWYSNIPKLKNYIERALNE